MSETEAQEQTAQNLPAVQDEKPQRVPIMSGAQPRALVPVDFDGAYRIATVAVRGGLNVRGLETVEKCMIAIMHGMEVGLTPMAALQSIAVINGRPTIYGDGAMGLVRGSTICEWVKETYVGTYPNDDYKAVCRVKRKGDPEVIEAEFSIADAKQARLWDTRERVTKKGRNGEYEGLNDSPWFKYPKRMLKMRARWALRDGFADVLKGLHLREEIEDMEPTAAEPMAPVKRAPPPPEEIAKPAEATATHTDASNGEEVGVAVKKDDGLDIPPMLDRRRAPPPPGEEEKPSEELWLISLENAFGSCEDASELAEAQQKHMMPAKDKVSPNAWKVADMLIRKHLARIQPAE